MSNRESRGAAGSCALDGVLSAEARPQGAEAVIAPAEVAGRRVLSKDRVPKGYRHPALDRQICDARTRDEANLLIAARRAGVPVPVVYRADRGGARILLEPIEGPRLRERLMEDDAAAAVRRLKLLGVHIARLHAAGLTHGDLTTSNVMVPDDDRLVLIDFGLGRYSGEPEAQGVDVHLLEEALEATDLRAPELMAAFLDGYHWPGRAAVLARLQEIRQRGRYR